MNCDKCGKEVEPKDDAVLIYAALTGNLFDVLAEARHIRCSPSRAQYIVHEDFPEVVDNRPQHDKRLKDPKDVKADELLWTQAWLIHTKQADTP